MIQPISNNVNFSGNVYLGGKTYGAIKRLAINISGVSNQKVQQSLKDNLNKLKDDIAQITPKDADLSLIIQAKAARQNGNKVKLTLRDNLDSSDIFSVSRAFSKNGRPGGVQKLLSNVKDKTTALFTSQQSETAEYVAKHINLSI